MNTMFFVCFGIAAVMLVFIGAGLYMIEHDIL